MPPAPLIVSEEHVGYALAELVRDGVLPDDFAERWIDVAKRTREQALRDLKYRDDHGPLFIVCDLREGDAQTPPEHVFVELEDVFGSSHGVDVGVQWKDL